MDSRKEYDEMVVWGSAGECHFDTTSSHVRPADPVVVTKREPIVVSLSRQAPTT